MHILGWSSVRRLLCFLQAVGSTVLLSSPHPNKLHDFVGFLLCPLGTDHPGFGLLKHLRPEELPELSGLEDAVEIQFNYLGKVLTGVLHPGVFSLSERETAPMRAGKNKSIQSRKPTYSPGNIDGSIKLFTSMALHIHPDLPGSLQSSQSHQQRTH